MKIYVVTQSKFPKTQVELPTLGVHTKETKAYRHFNNVLQDRQARGGQILWNRNFPKNYPSEKNWYARRALIQYEDNTQEEIFLEVWKPRQPVVNPINP